MSKRGQRSGARWSLAILAGCLGIASAQAQQTTGSGEQGGFVVIEDAQPAPPPPAPLALPARAASVTVAAVVAPAAPAPQFKPLPTLPPNALPLIERTPPVAPAPRPKPVGVASIPSHPVTSFAVMVKKADPSVESYTIPPGTMLSKGLTDYVKRYGWELRWMVKEDFRLDAPLPIPAGAMKDGVNYVVHAYQVQGGLMGDTPNYHNPNKFVVIEPVTAAREMHE